MPRAPPPPAFDRRFILEPDAHLQQQDVTSDLLSVASFNMLADALHLAGKPRQQFDRWEHRWPVLEAQLETLTADIVCLQEVDEKTFYKHLIPFFTARGYTGELQDGGRRRWGNATFWVRHKFAKCVVDNRSRILVTKLRYVWGRQNVFVVNVHLQAAPWAELERVQQLSKALRRCETRHGCRLPRDHIIVAGDFNSSFKSKTAQFTMGTSSFRASELMSQDDVAATDRGSAGGGRRGNGGSQARRHKGRQDKELERDPTDVAYRHAFRLAHAASTVDRMAAKAKKGRPQQGRTKRPTAVADVGTFCTEGAYAVDHIFFSPDTMEVVQVRQPVDEAERRRHRRFPNERFGSDHFPVAAVFRLRLYRYPVHAHRFDFATRKLRAIPGRGDDDDVVGGELSDDSGGSSSSSSVFATGDAASVGGRGGVDSESDFGSLGRRAPPGSRRLRRGGDLDSSARRGAGGATWSVAAARSAAEADVAARAAAKAGDDSWMGPAEPAAPWATLSAAADAGRSHPVPRVQPRMVRHLSAPVVVEASDRVAQPAQPVSFSCSGLGKTQTSSRKTARATRGGGGGGGGGGSASGSVHAGVGGSAHGGVGAASGSVSGVGVASGGAGGGGAAAVIGTTAPAVLDFEAIGLQRPPLVRAVSAGMVSPGVAAAAACAHRRRRRLRALALARAGAPPTAVSRGALLGRRRGERPL